MSINVTVVGATGVSASITNTEVVNVAAGTAMTAQVPQLRVEAGANITITTTSGSFTVIGRDVPVQSVQGRTGNVVLTRADLTAASAVHSHAASSITDLTSVANVVSVNGRTGVVTLAASDITNLTSVANVVSVNGRTGVVTLNSTLVSAASAVHSHVASDITNLTSVANVVSVNGRTGVVTLNSTLVSAASAVHSHVAASITDLTSVANVVSVAGRTGVVTLSAADVTGLAAVATSGSAADLSGTLPNARLSANVVILDGSNLIPSAYLPSYVDDVLEYANLAGFPVTGETAKIYVALDNNKAYRWSGSAYIEISPSPGSTDSVAEGSVNLYFTSGRAAAAAPVQSVNAKSGTVVLTSTDVSAASAVHSHVAADITNLTSVANVVSVNGRTGVVSIAASDVTAASSTHAHNYVQSLNGLTGTPSIVAGSNVTVTTAAGSITIASGGGGVGNVTSVAGRTGTVVLTVADIGNITSVANVVSVNGRTGVVTIAASDVTAASSTHAHDYVQSLNGLTGTPSIVAGSNVTVTTAANSITIASGGGVSSVNGQAGAVSLVAGSNVSLSTAAGSITIGALTAQSLIIGTVTSGTAAAASITGSPPALNLTLPAGAAGPAGPAGAGIGLIIALG